jgi:hypothetical protein
MGRQARLYFNVNLCENSLMIRCLPKQIPNFNLTFI